MGVGGDGVMLCFLILGGDGMIGIKEMRGGICLLCWVRFAGFRRVSRRS